MDGVEGRPDERRGRRSDGNGRRVQLLKKARGASALAEDGPCHRLDEAGGQLQCRTTELPHAKLIRAIDLPRQASRRYWWISPGQPLQRDVKKGRCVVYKVSDDREVIRPNVFGNFRDMLGHRPRARQCCSIWITCKTAYQPRTTTAERAKREEGRRNGRGAQAIEEARAGHQ